MLIFKVSIFRQTHPKTDTFVTTRNAKSHLSGVSFGYAGNRRTH